MPDDRCRYWWGGCALGRKNRSVPKYGRSTEIPAIERPPVKCGIERSCGYDFRTWDEGEREAQVSEIWLIKRIMRVI